MRAVIRTGAAVRSAWATRGDLLLETLALHHQLGVLARRRKAFAQLTVCFGCFCGACGPVAEALVLIQPAHVDRWRPEGVRRCWRRRSRRPGRPRIDSPCRDLIGVWPRRIVSGRSADPRRIAEARNHHFGTHRLALFARPPDYTVTNLAYILREPPRWPNIVSQVMFADAHDEDVVVDASALSFRQFLRSVRLRLHSRADR